MKSDVKKLMLVGALAGIATHTFADSIGEYDSANWVAQVYQGRGHTTLRQMVIPGTHDSGTYNMNSSSDLAPDANAIYAAAKGVVADWGRTQSYDIYTMLQKGIRHFDLRILRKDNEFVIVHGLVGMKVRDVLAQVQQFANEHPKEPIILEVDKTPSASDMPALLDMFDEYLATRKPDTNIRAAHLTLNDLWKEDPVDGVNNNVVVMWGSSSSQGEARGYYGASQKEGTWADTENSTDLHNRLLNGWVRNGRVYKGLKNASQDKIVSSSFTFTPQTSTIIEDVFNVFSSGSILKWTQDWMRPYLGEWVPGWVEQGYRPNIMTADFFEYTAMIPLAVKLNTIEPAQPTQSLIVARAPGVDKIWGDHGSGADRDGAIWRPRTANGYYPLGDIPTGSHHFDHNVQLYLVKGDQIGVTKPLGYNWVWNDRGTGADTDASIWRPIAPNGYVCLGDVATTNHGLAPSTDLIRCVHKSYVTASPYQNFKWNDAGSGGKYDVSLWDGHNPDGSTLNIGSMRANRSHSQPSKNLFQLIKRKSIEDIGL
ncbi:phosphatidylinositol-specific phospholipase C domain-containing protein [Pleionea sp. CnH1-48]|uniref:phosphatidylinositol-specific phospholipase C domain-containing protein n=1 Tax=Pleionea sp. CnH1-48 TaxID=2954494 RepID=UPI002096E79D|nr:phosphatidylinositol-specific phospholipase C domain-containing protein [Pleionea sp. CnH1-48]MCO7224763.1 phosphatidylinositol-specific phospholipase C domain-containing protein [Pleionea sp. CnH1-48]